MTSLQMVEILWDITPRCEGSLLYPFHLKAIASIRRDVIYDCVELLVALSDSPWIKERIEIEFYSWNGYAAPKHNKYKTQ